MHAPRYSALLTDLYELSMLDVYRERGMHETAVFEFFVRMLPESRGFLLAAGLDQVLDYLENFRFTAEELEWLAGKKLFRREFIDWLAGLRFTGAVHAMPEGSVFFANEPILRVTAPMPEAQIVESRLINLLHLQTLVASKAARSVLAAPGRTLVDFGMRRAHGAEAALFAARASYLAGFTGTATVLAGRLYEIPIFGTMAHSFIQAHRNETDAFRAFALSQPGNVVLLIDTYDTEAGARKVVDLAPELRERGIPIKAIRLDSGDPAVLAPRVRSILDEGGCTEVGIFCSGSMDEEKIAALLAGGAPIGGFGVGTALDVSADAPYLDCVYKLQEYAGEARRKRSTGKATWPGRKQVYRHYAGDGRMNHDVLATEDESCGGEPLIGPQMQDGRRIGPAPGLAAARERAAAEMARLPGDLRRLRGHGSYRVEVSPGLRALTEEVDRRFP